MSIQNSSRGEYSKGDTNEAPIKSSRRNHADFETKKQRCVMENTHSEPPKKVLKKEFKRNG